MQAACTKETSRPSRRSLPEVYSYIQRRIITPSGALCARLGIWVPFNKFIYLRLVFDKVPPYMSAYGVNKGNLPWPLPWLRHRKSFAVRCTQNPGYESHYPFVRINLFYICAVFRLLLVLRSVVVGACPILGCLATRGSLPGPFLPIAGVRAVEKYEGSGPFASGSLVAEPAFVVASLLDPPEKDR